MAPCLKLKEEQIKFLNNWISQIETEQLLKSGAISLFEFDDYIKIQSSGNREFKTIGNTQANIDTIIETFVSPVVPLIHQTVYDNLGNIYSVSSNMDSVSLNYHITKTDSTNSIIWEQIFDGKNGGADSSYAILMDDNSFLYVIGKSWNGIDYDVVTLKYDTAGNMYWKAMYNDMVIGNDEPIGFEIDSTFRMKVYVKSSNDSVQLFKTIYYSQCDTACAQNYRLKKANQDKSLIVIDADLTLQVYPTPASDKLNVLLKSNSHSETFLMKMYDMTGKLVFSRKINYKYVMDISNFKKGVYQLVISDNSHSLRHRIVID
ncbi:MAG: T9SS type A sorting domain-containing protein [Bacteroidetes bacterium]|nr:T9SS type A sorting domain-containing protein [Bacteroidota bacterium]